MSEELKNAFGTWNQQQTPANMSSLLRVASPIMDKAVTTYAGRQSPVLKSKAKSLAIKAFRSYNPNMGTKLRTHLMTQLQPLRRSAIRSGQIIREPERMVYDRRTLHNAQRTFIDQFGRDPAQDELADTTGLSVRRIRAIQKTRPAVATGQFGDTHEIATEDDSAADMWMEYVYHDLDPRDKQILDWKLGRHGQERISSTEIARRLGISSAAVSKRTANIATRLQEGEGIL